MFAQSDSNPRERVFHLQREVRRDLHQWLETHFATHPEGRTDAAFLGLNPDGSFEVHSARFALRHSPDGEIDAQVIIGVTQRASIRVDPALPGLGEMTFEGGSTIVGDVRRLRIRYCVRKNVNSANRRARQQAFMVASLDSPRMTYFGAEKRAETRDEELEPFAAMHRGLER